MRTSVVLPTVAAAALLAAPARPQDKASPPPGVKELQKERIAVLNDLVEVTAAFARTGRGTLDEALDARLLLLEAELDAAESGADRVALLKGVVATLKEYEAYAAAQKELARSTAVPGLKIKARRLEAEVRLEREKAKESAQSK